MKTFFKFTTIACICCVVSILACGCFAFDFSLSTMSENEWENALDYNTKYSYTISNINEDITQKVYIDNNLTKTRITKVSGDENYEEIYFTEQDSDKCWMYYYDTNESKWAKGEIENDEGKDVFALLSGFLKYEYFTYNEDTETYIAENISIVIDGNEDIADKVEVIFTGKKLRKVEITWQENSGIALIYEISYRTNFTITLPTIKNDGNGSGNGGYIYTETMNISLDGAESAKSQTLTIYSGTPGEQYLVPGNNIQNPNIEIYNRSNLKTYMVVVYSITAITLDEKVDISEQLTNTPAIDFCEGGFDTNIWKKVAYQCQNKDATYVCLVGIEPFEMNNSEGFNVCVNRENSLKIPAEWGDVLQNFVVTISASTYAIQADNLSEIDFPNINSSNIDLRANEIAKAVFQITGEDCAW